MRLMCPSNSPASPAPPKPFSKPSRAGEPSLPYPPLSVPRSSSAPEPSRSFLSLWAASPRASRAAAVLRLLGEALLERHLGIMSATTSPPAVAGLRSASGESVATLKRGEEHPIPSARLPALLRPLVAGCTSN
ncbi:hypothetical protein D1007_60190 [Hordeum vulgare]|nr:hypothetical protein D1007_60190 [Hordeum vulgare]